jgi:hypothetical protein
MSKREIYKDIEIAYAEDSTGWVEGMNEYSVGFIYSYLQFKDAHYYKWKSIVTQALT